MAWDVSIQFPMNHLKRCSRHNRFCERKGQLRHLTSHKSTELQCPLNDPVMCPVKYVVPWICPLTSSIWNLVAKIVEIIIRHLTRVFRPFARFIQALVRFWDGITPIITWRWSFSTGHCCEPLLRRPGHRHCRSPSRRGKGPYLSQGKQKSQ